MRVLLLGNTGQLGWELERALAPLGQVLAVEYPELNLTDLDGTRTLLRRMAPFDVVVNATGYTAVDKAELADEHPLVKAINHTGPGVLAEEAQRLGAALVHYSTDFVFDGAKTTPYVETDKPNPIGYYAQSKLDGELAVEQMAGSFITLRTAWMYSLRRPSFVSRVLQWARQKTTLKFVTDQVRSPTWARLLAEATAQLLALGGENVVPWLAERKGVYHLAGSGQASMYDWAQETLRLDPHKEEQMVQTVLPALTADFADTAPRPLFTPLNCDKFAAVFGLRLPAWQTALRLALDVS